MHCYLNFQFYLLVTQSFLLFPIPFLVTIVSLVATILGVTDILNHDCFDFVDFTFYFVHFVCVWIVGIVILFFLVISNARGVFGNIVCWLKTENSKNFDQNFIFRKIIKKFKISKIIFWNYVIFGNGIGKWDGYH